MRNQRVRINQRPVGSKAQVGHRTQEYKRPVGIGGPEVYLNKSPYAREEK